MLNQIMILSNLKEAPHSNDAIGELQGKKYHNASYLGFPRVELKNQDADYAHERNVAINCSFKDGVKPMTKAEQEFERKLNKEIIKKFTMAIFKMDVTKFSFPVGYNEPRTFLERSTDLFSFLVTEYIEKALQQSNPAERLAYVATGIIAGFQFYLQQKKPWNPLLGETYVGEWSNGTRIYGEQTCHHPPISNIQVIPTSGKWRINAQFNFGIDPGVTKVVVLQKGLTSLELNDGTRIEWEFPNIAATGILTGERVVKVQGPFILHDRKNRLDANININPSKTDEKHFKKDQKDAHKMSYEELEEMHYKNNNKRNKNKDKAKATLVQGGVKSANKDSYSVLIQGDYCDHVFVNEKMAWDIHNDITSRPLNPIPENDLLPSDCRFRIDRGMLINNDMDAADRAKNLIEELQRHDYKLRESVHKSRK